MKLIIDIPKANYEKMKKKDEEGALGNPYLMAIAQGTPFKEPKTGYWFIDERPESNRETICSRCEQPIFKYHKVDFDYRPRYCPNCGAKME